MVDTSGQNLARLCREMDIRKKIKYTIDIDQTAK